MAVYIIVASEQPNTREGWERTIRAAKIGLAKDVRARLRELQVSNHLFLSVLGELRLSVENTASGPSGFGTDAKLERYLHWLFKRSRVRGEWFEGRCVKDWYDGPKFRRDLRTYLSDHCGARRNYGVVKSPLYSQHWPIFEPRTEPKPKHTPVPKPYMRTYAPDVQAALDRAKADMRHALTIPADCMTEAEKRKALDAMCLGTSVYGRDERGLFYSNGAIVLAGKVRKHLGRWLNQVNWLTKTLREQYQPDAAAQQRES